MKTLNILLVEDSPEYSSLVLQSLSRDPNQTEFSLVWTDSLAAALARLEKGGIDLILMDLGLPDSDGLKTFTALRKQREDLPIIVLSAADNQALALQTIQQGAEDYLVKSTCTPDLLVRTLRHAVARHQVVATRTRAMESACLARVIGVLGGAGGAGTTTVACVLAAELRNRTDQPTLLIDLDSSPGLVSFAMGIEPQFTVQDLACNTSRLDLSLWEGMITHSPGSPDILASARAVTAPDSDAENLRTVVNFAANHYRWIVMDLGRLSPTSKKLLPAATDIILVSAQSISALHQCKHAIETIHDLGVEDDRVRLILNRIHEGQPLPRKELENLFGVPIAAVLPPAHEDLQDAYLDRRLPNVTGSFRIALGEVVRKMAGLPGEAPKWSRLSLTSLAERFRRRGEAVKASAAS